MAKRICAAALLVLAAPFAAFAQTAGSWLEGSWQGAGSFRGGESVARLDVAPVLGGRFVEFDYRFEASAGEGDPTRFEGRGYYRRDGEEAWTGVWLDSGGAIHDLRGTMADGALETLWGAQGRTSYRLIGDGRLEIVDSFRSADGEWREFARHALVRISPSP